MKQNWIGKSILELKKKKKWTNLEDLLKINNKVARGMLKKLEVCFR